MSEVFEVFTSARTLQPCSAHLSVTLAYDPAAPFAATLTLPDPDSGPVPWVLDRDMLRAGMDRLVGMGWVQVFPLETGEVGLYLTDDTVCLLLCLPRQPVARFLARSYVAVPPGREAEWLDVDAALEALLDEATP